MSVDFKELQALYDRLSTTDVQEIEVACAKELAARLLRAAVKATPTGIYDSAYGHGVGGYLKRAWTTTVPKVNTEGCTIEVINPAEYASYVEYGHRQQPGRFVPAIGKRLKATWVEGKLMLTDAENNLRPKADAIVQRKVEKILKEMLDGNK